MRSRKGAKKKKKQQEKIKGPLENAITSFDWISTKQPKGLRDSLA
jgi:hypothetical protein